MPEKVELIKNDKEKLSVDLLSEFSIEIDGTPRKFILMTANEIDQNGLVKILASEIKDGKIIKIESDDDWTIVKNIMRSIISSSKGDYTYTNTSDNMSYEVSDDYARVIAVRDDAKQALVNDYEENKPEPEDVIPQENETTEDPNAVIYPTESEATPIGSELVSGIAEVNPDAETKEEVKEEESTEEEPQDIVPNDAVIPEIPTANAEEEVTNETTDNTSAFEDTVVVSTVSTNDSARDELVNSIIAAVDKYIASSKPSVNTDMQDTIAKMQEELNKMSETLKTQA